MCKKKGSEIIVCFKSIASFGDEHYSCSPELIVVGYLYTVKMYSCDGFNKTEGSTASQERQAGLPDRWEVQRKGNQAT